MMWSHLLLKGTMVTICGGCDANNILVLLTKFVPPSLSTQVALVNGHCKVIFTSIRLLFYWLVPILHHKISLNVVAPILELIVVVGNPCLSTQHTYNNLMMHLMMKIATKIILMRSALLTLGGVTMDEDGPKWMAQMFDATPWKSDVAWLHNSMLALFPHLAVILAMVSCKWTKFGKC